MFSNLQHDLRYALRMLSKTPAASLLILLGLATTIALSIATGQLWQTLNFPDVPGVENSRGLMTFGTLGTDGVDIISGSMSANQIKELSARSQTLDRVTGASIFAGATGVEIEGQPLEGRIEPVLPNYFETIRPRIALGRGLDSNDFGRDAAQVVVLSHALWQDVFDGDPDWVGRTVSMADHSWRIVGVVDPEYKGIGDQAALLWLPYRQHNASFGNTFPDQVIDNIGFYRMIARQREGIGQAAILDEAETILDSFSATGFASSTPRGPLTTVPGLTSQPDAQREAERQARHLLIAAGLLVVIALMNVSLFLLVRTPARAREMALRFALGASRKRLVRQIMVESVVLVALSLALSGLISIAVLATLSNSALFASINLDQAGWNGPIFTSVLILSLLICLLISIAPIRALKATNLAQSSRRQAKPSRPILISVAFAQLLFGGIVIAVALAFVINLWILERTDIGLDSGNVLSVRSTLDIESLGGAANFQTPTEDIMRGYFQALMDRLGNVSGVESVALMSPVPGSKSSSFMSLRQDDQTLTAQMIQISPGLLDTLNIQLLHGRDFDGMTDSGVLVNKTLAESLWGRVDVIGEFIQRGMNPQVAEDDRVIGVVDDIVIDHPGLPPKPLLFSLNNVFSLLAGEILVKGDPNRAELERTVEEIQDQYMPELRVVNVEPLDAAINRLTRLDRTRSQTTLTLAALAILFAGLGFVFIQRFIADQERREVAIRMALGAGPKTMRRALLMRGIVHALPALLMVSPLALIATVWLADDYITSAVQPWWVGLGTSLILTGLVALATLPTAASVSKLKLAETLKQD